MEVIEIDWKLIERTERLLKAKNLRMPSSPETVETLHQGITHMAQIIRAFHEEQKSLITRIGHDRPEPR
jgi:hypothetical protein